jgi:gliding motility-associated-like protein
VYVIHEEMKKLIYISVLLSAVSMFAQSPSISPQVLNSAGEHRQLGNANIYITDNIGEPFIETTGSTGNNYITQGFLQPDVVSNIGFVLETKVKNVACFQKKDGEIHLTFISAPISTTLISTFYDWSPAGTCPTNNCKDLYDLPADSFSVKITLTYSNAVGSIKADTLVSGPIVITDTGLPCNITAYSGISANGDGANDVFTIKNIEEFPNNRVLIYNRWGKLIADVKNYNNTTNAWPILDEVDSLLATTYFYLIDLGDGSKVIKGWVELMKD